MLKSECVQYGRKFDLGNFQSLTLDITLWATIHDNTLIESIMATLWQMAKNNLRYAYVKDVKNIHDDTILMDSLIMDYPSDAFTIDTISVTLGKKVNTGAKYENAEIRNSLWYTMGTKDEYLPACVALWQSVFNNVAAASPQPDNPMRNAKLGVEIEDSTPPNVLSSNPQYVLTR